jgi:hypothetical protein
MFISDNSMEQSQSLSFSNAPVMMPQVIRPQPTHPPCKLHTAQYICCYIFKNGTSCQYMFRSSAFSM